MATTIILAIIEIVIRALLPALAAGASSTAEDGARQPELRARLTEAVRGRWVAVLVVACLAVASGCQRTVYVPTGEPVRLRATVRAAKVWVLDANGQAIAGTMDLPAGWYCLPDPGEGQ